MSSENNIKAAVIVLDSGFASESMARVRNLLGYMDLNSGISVVGQPMVEGQARELVLALAQDKLNHGTIILERLLALDPDLPIVLVRGFAPEGGLIRTVFEQGKIVRDGWTEGYLWAQNLCASKGYLSVANFSFGGFHHAIDGSGWESFQLGKVVGPGKPGHLLAAAAGPGDGRAVHASLSLEGGGNAVVHARQESASTYNLWVNRLPAAVPSATGQTQPVVDVSLPHSNQASPIRDFEIEVRIDGRLSLAYSGKDLVANIWNGKQQITFAVPGAGLVEIALKLASGPAARFDVYISREGENAHFLDCVDSELVCEPAVYSQVIAVGLKQGSYGDCLVQGLTKPEVLLDGNGPISFRTPEITFALARLLNENPSLDVTSARAELHRLWYQNRD
jgi:hypothetical protein